MERAVAEETRVPAAERGRWVEQEEILRSEIAALLEQVRPK